MRRMLILLAAFVLILSFVSCGVPADTGTPSSQNALSQTDENTSELCTSEENTESAIETMSKPIIYDIPAGITQSDLYDVTIRVEGDDTAYSVGCYTALVGTTSQGTEKVNTEEMAFCVFDFDYSKKLFLTVKPKNQASSVAVLPESAGVKSDYADGAVTVELTKPCKLSVEFDGNIYNNLFVYANAPETDIPDENDSSVIYFAPGIHDAGTIEIKSGCTVYIAGGAYVYGNIVSNDTHHVAVRGHGILSGEKIDHKYGGSRKVMIDFENCRNVAMDGIIILDSPTWTVKTSGCKTVDFSDIKQIAYNFNSDGFDICGSEDVMISDSFIRNWDDNISVKAFDNKNSVNITMKDSILWADCAHNMLVGPEAKDAETENLFSNITFENIDVLEENEKSDFYRGCMSLTCSDNSVYDGITWKNIRIERMSYGRLFNFRFSSDYGTTVGKSISNIIISDVECKNEYSGGDIIIGLADRYIHDITIENVKVAGNTLTHGNNFFSKNNLRYIESLTIDGKTEKID